MISNRALTSGGSSILRHINKSSRNDGFCWTREVGEEDKYGSDVLGGLEAHRSEATRWWAEVDLEGVGAYSKG